MKGVTLSVGFLPLVDAAPLIVAQEMGFAAEEGLSLDLVRAPSWSSVRDMLAFGRVDAAHMLAPAPVATALGLGGASASFDVLAVLSINGNMITVTTALADRIRAAGHGFAFDDADSAGRALVAAAPGRLRFGVPFPFSMHAELLYYWLSRVGLHAPQDIDIRTVPPPLMVDAMVAGEIDACCVGEPWGSLAVEEGVGTQLLPTRAIWARAPEKVLAVRSDWAAEDHGFAHRLVRAVWRAGRWLADPGSRVLASELLARPEFLGLPAELIDRALSGAFTISPQGEQRRVPGFVDFHSDAAMFPWREQAQWIGYQLAARTGLDRAQATQRAGRVFRPDIFRAALARYDADLARGAGGALDPLAPDAFFDPKPFVPELGQDL